MSSLPGRWCALGAACALLACSPGGDAAGGEEGAVLLEGARLVVGDGTVIERGALLFEGGRILAVGPADEIRVAGAARVDLSGRTVTPALVDAHAHLGYEGYTTWGADAYTRDNLIDHLERYAYYGFGTVLSAGTDPNDLALDVQRAQARGEVGGARLVLAAGVAPPEQGPNDRFLREALALEERTGQTILRGVVTGDDARAAVDEIASLGIPFVKIWVDDRGGTQRKLAPDLYRAIAAEARAQGLGVLVHQQSVADVAGLLDAGVTGFLHGRLGPALDARVAERIAGAGVFVVPNLGLSELRGERIADDPFLAETLPPAVVARLGAAFDERQAAAEAAPADTARERELAEAMQRLLEAGVDIVLGTDAGVVPDHFFGYAGHRELEIFVRLGMSPAEAIVAATGRAAERLGLDDTGTLAPGKRADLVVLAGNPLEDIRATRTIERVWLRGEEVDRAALRERWSRTPSAP
ncbi:MAG TPA: amidohydrolase family protein [Longimicrobiales bacterium]|nr:amidohydrolase family protein [Longimicrobiales bacterium]